MELTLLPLQKDDLLRLRSEGPISQRDSLDPVQTLLGPHCYTHKVLLNLDLSPAIDTSGVCWLVHCSKRFLQAGGKLVLYAVPPVVLDVLDFLHVRSLLHIAPNEQAATDLLLVPTPPPARDDSSAAAAIRFPR
jgi:ABC-type transporter Mla MlaB component